MRSILSSRALGFGLPAFALLAVLPSACGPAGEASSGSSSEAGLRTTVRLEPANTCAMADADWAKVLGNPRHNPARTWNEMNLALIRRDIPMPTVHARNLYTLSRALYEVWARYRGARPLVSGAIRLDGPTTDTALHEAMHHAAYRVLSYRYNLSQVPGPLVACTQVLMSKLGLDPSRTATGPTSGAEFGNAVGHTILESMFADGANERNRYQDTTGWQPVNPPLDVSAEGTTMPSPSLWQQLRIEEQDTQSGIFIPGQLQPYIGPHWGQVAPFAMPEPDQGELYFDVGRPPGAGTPEMRSWLEDFFGKNGAHVSTDEIDASPGALGNNPLGTESGRGHTKNPVTGAPYPANTMKRSDFAQVLAEFWADGPHSETPPGHWNVIANEVADTPGFATKLNGRGRVLPRMEWDVKMYLALNGALHDSAIAAWGLKRKYTSARPISLIRYASQWQSSNPDGPRYEAQGLPLIPGVVEQVTRASASDPTRHFGYPVGSIAVKAFDGVVFDWMRASRWMPFQAASFVTPAFPGFVSGHSTFSRAAAEVLTSFTGSAFFPGGVSKVRYDLSKRTIAPRREEIIELQWATYYDAADQAGASRIYGGIHIGADDFAGRKLGNWVGKKALERVEPLFR